MLKQAAIAVVLCHVLFPASAYAQLRAYVTNASPNSVTVIDTATNAATKTINLPARPFDIAVTPDGSRAYVVHTVAGSVSVLDLVSGTLLTTLAVGPFPQGVAITPDGLQAWVVIGDGNEVVVLDTGNHEIVATIPVGACPRKVAIDTLGKYAFVTNACDSTMSIIDVAMLATAGTPGVPNFPNGVAVNHEGDRVYITHSSSLQSFSAYDVESGQIIAVRKFASAGTQGIVVAADDTRVFMGVSTGIAVIDASSNALLSTIPFGFATNGLDVTPDGATVHALSAGGAGFFAAAINAHTNAVGPSLQLGFSSSWDLALGRAPVPPSGTIHVSTNLPAATFTLTGPETYMGAGVSFTQSGAPPGSYTITYGNVGGYVPPTSGTLTLDAGGAISFSGTYVPVPTPEILSIAPAHARLGQTVEELTITGDHFASGASVDVVGCGVTVNSSTRISPQTIVASISIVDTETVCGGADPVVAKHEVRVFNPSGDVGALDDALDVKRRPVIVIPGIMASDLRRVDNDGALWTFGHLLRQGGTSYCDPHLLPLMMDTDGSTPMPQTTYRCSNGEVYEFEGANARATGPFSDFYDGLVDRLRNQGFEPIVFAYDWRRDYETTAHVLRSLILSVSSDPTALVDVVAHSQGGLVTRMYGDIFHDDARIHSMVYLGTPHLGSPKAFAIGQAWTNYESYYGTAVPLQNLKTFSFVTQNFPSGYALLPHLPFFVVDGRLEDLATTLSHMPNSALVTRARDVWARLDQHRWTPARAVAIDGSGRNTLLSIRSEPGRHCLVPGNDPQGDATVPQASASAVPPGTALFYINEEHGKLPNNATVGIHVPLFLRGLDVSEMPGVIEQQPFRASGWIAAYTCSPVAMQVHDSDGRMMGLDNNGDLRQDIDNGQFFAFPSNDSAFLPADTRAQIQLRATGDGTFLLALDYFDDLSQQTQSVRFEGVPVSVSSIATVELDGTGGTASMQLDVNGDGTFDFTVGANQPSPPGSFASVLLDVIARANLAAGLAQELSTTVRQILASIERGNVAAARGQLQAFKLKIGAQAGKGLSPEHAATLSQLVGAIVIE